jgi:pyruvate dehydrogenase E1 component
LRGHFEVNAQNISVAALSSLAHDGVIAPTMVAKAIDTYGIDPDSIDPRNA